mmetsp:Transcript_20437/g.49259  ORF Transcript_20437/g.49259 Transcript_20437/m.49259 type:complete len:278 (+) Transcript_20437:346-1179(+)
MFLLPRSSKLANLHPIVHHVGVAAQPHLPQALLLMSSRARSKVVVAGTFDFPATRVGLLAHGPPGSPVLIGINIRGFWQLSTHVAEVEGASCAFPRPDFHPPGVTHHAEAVRPTLATTEVEIKATIVPPEQTWRAIQPIKDHAIMNLSCPLLLHPENCVQKGCAVATRLILEAGVVSSAEPQRQTVVDLAVPANDIEHVPLIEILVRGLERVAGVEEHAVQPLEFDRVNQAVTLKRLSTLSPLNHKTPAMFLIAVAAQVHGSHRRAQRTAPADVCNH